MEENGSDFGYVGFLLGLIAAVIIRSLGYPWWFAIVIVLSPLILCLVLWLLVQLVILIWDAVDYFKEIKMKKTFDESDRKSDN